MEISSFHLPVEQTIVFNDGNTIDDVLFRPINERLVDVMS